MDCKVDMNDDNSLIDGIVSILFAVASKIDSCNIPNGISESLKEIFDTSRVLKTILDSEKRELESFWRKKVTRVKFEDLKMDGGITGRAVLEEGYGSRVIVFELYLLSIDDLRKVYKDAEKLGDKYYLFAS